MVFVVCAGRAGHRSTRLVLRPGHGLFHGAAVRRVRRLIPRTSSEKVEKYKLKTWAEQNKATLWDREKEGIVIAR